MNQKGMTLIEVTIGTVIMLLILGGVAGVMWTSVRAYQTNTAQTQNMQAARNAMTVILDELRRGSNITLPSPNTINYRLSGMDKSIYVSNDPNHIGMIVTEDDDSIQELTSLAAKPITFQIQATAVINGVEIAISTDSTPPVIVRTMISTNKLPEVN